MIKQILSGIGIFIAFTAFIFFIALVVRRYETIENWGMTALNEVEYAIFGEVTEDE